jgi:hypothetical protein
MRKLAAAGAVFLGVVGVVAAVAMSRPDRTIGLEPRTDSVATEPPADGLAPLVDYEQLLDSMNASADPELLEAADRALKTLPDTKVAGAWVDPESDRLAVGVTDQSIGTTVADALEARGVDDAAIELVAHSEAELDRIVQGVYDLRGMGSISSAMHDYASNRVILTCSTRVTERLRRKAYGYFGDAVAIASVPEEAYAR